MLLLLDPLTLVGACAALGASTRVDATPPTSRAAVRAARGPPRARSGSRTTRPGGGCKFVLVRHADAGDKHRWADRDALRPLSAKGQRQAAESVAPQLWGLGVDRLLSSPTVRCVQTLTPAAERLGLAVERREELAVRGSVVRLLRLLESPDTDGTALCTHGEILTTLSRAWQRSGRVVFDPDGLVAGLAGMPKGASWIIAPDLDGDAVTTRERRAQATPDADAAGRPLEAMRHVLAQVDDADENHAVVGDPDRSSSARPGSSFETGESPAGTRARRSG